MKIHEKHHLKSLKSVKIFQIPSDSFKILEISLNFLEIPLRFLKIPLRFLENSFKKFL